jgi:phosphate starvation-inducible PhoH-like protein
VAKSKSLPSSELQVTFRPKTPNQQAVIDLWPRSRILFLLGEAGCGKTHVALAMALTECLRRKDEKGSRRPKIMLTRPMVAVGESIGYLPGDVDEKVGPWLLPFHDVLGGMTFTSWDDLQKDVDIEQVPVGLLRGRTISNGVLIADESQNLSYAQLVCLLTRIGYGGRIVICADPTQSELFTSPKLVPVVQVAKKLADLDTVSVVQFTRADIVRDPLVAEILDRL